MGLDHILDPCPVASYQAKPSLVNPSYLVKPSFPVVAASSSQVVAASSSLVVAASSLAVVEPSSFQVVGPSWL